MFRYHARRGTTKKANRDENHYQRARQSERRKNPKSEAQIGCRSDSWIFCLPRLAAKPVPGVAPPVFGFRLSGLLRISPFGLRIYPTPHFTHDQRRGTSFLRPPQIHLYYSSSTYSTPFNWGVCQTHLRFFAVFCSFLHAHPGASPGIAHGAPSTRSASSGNPRKTGKLEISDLHTLTSGFRMHPPRLAVRQNSRTCHGSSRQTMRNRNICHLTRREVNSDFQMGRTYVRCYN